MRFDYTAFVATLWSRCTTWKPGFNEHVAKILRRKYPKQIHVFPLQSMYIWWYASMTQWELNHKLTHPRPQPQAADMKKFGDNSLIAAQGYKSCIQTLLQLLSTICIDKLQDMLQPSTTHHSPEICPSFTIIHPSFIHHSNVTQFGESKKKVG